MDAHDIIASDQQSTRVTWVKVYGEWRRYWNVSRSVLVEKSPRHMLMTRLLQHWFTPLRTHFLIVLRHPVRCVAWHDRRALIGTFMRV